MRNSAVLLGTESATKPLWLGEQFGHLETDNRFNSYVNNGCLRIPNVQ